MNGVAGGRPGSSNERFSQKPDGDDDDAPRGVVARPIESPDPNFASLFKNIPLIIFSQCPLAEVPLRGHFSEYKNG